MARMQILTASAIEAFDTPPLFDHRERQAAFDFSGGLIKISQSLRQPAYQVLFLVSCGYFKISKRFFAPSAYHQRDLEYVAHRLSIQVENWVYPDRSRQRHQKLILDFYGCRPFDDKASNAVAVEVATMTRQHLKPRLIFERCTEFLAQQKVQIPKSGTLIELIRLGLQSRKAELIDAISGHLSADAKAQLDNLFTTDESGYRYRLTLLKRISQSNKPTQIRETVTDYATVAELFEQLASTIDTLALGPAGIRYFAQSVLKAKIFQIQRRADADRYIHAAAFICHQFYRLNDTLVDQMLNAMANFQSTATRHHKEKLFDQRQEQTAHLKAVVNDLDQSVFGFRQTVERLTNDDVLTDHEKVDQIKRLLTETDPPSIEHLKADLDDVAETRHWHEMLERQSQRLQNRVSPILRALAFEADNPSNPLLLAITNFKANSSPELTFLSDQERSALTRDDGTFRLSLYKVFLFQHVAAEIKAGNLNLRRSYKYRPMDSYLIDATRWKNERVELLERAGLTEFIDPRPLLASLKERLHSQYRLTNANAAANLHLRFRADGQFVLDTPAAGNTLETDNSLFPQRHDVPLAQILEVINSTSGMLSAFEHWQQTHSQTQISRAALFASIIGLGCGIGVRKMARISSSVTEDELEHAVNWRFSLENIQSANDKVLQAMDALEIPELYQAGERLHTASDGQKFEVRGDALHASRSFKYFGQGKGVSAYTFIDERHRLWHSLVISAADRESAYVIDGLMRNDVVKSDLHSTDTHGYTEAIFGLTYLLGFAFAPRIKALAKQSLYQFHGLDRDERKSWKIGPDKYVNESLIIANWDQLLRLVATIKLKESTASDIFRRLNSYSRQHALYQTTKAFGQIIKSLFVLQYVDDVSLRQAIERQLNKVELANRFTRAVAVGNPREFTQTNKEEQEVTEACNRLIKNSIICWNMLYLNRKLERTTDIEARAILIAAIRSRSPMSWEHVNMLGWYDFSDETLRDSLGILPAKFRT